MLSYPDFAEKQIIVITSDEYKQLSLRNSNLLIKDEEGNIINQVSCAKIFCLFIIGDCTITTKLLTELMGYGISISFLGSHLKPRFIVANPLEGNYILRGKQYTSTKDFICAKHIIINKITNQLGLLQVLRDKSDTLKDNIRQIKDFQKKATMSINADSLRGIEGNVSKLFFREYFAETGRYKRLPRTKVDVVNFLLDMGYSFLYSYIEAHLQLYGFDVYKGVYHTLFFERKSLVCDIVEPFRCIIDHAIRKAYNLGQINEKDFHFVKGQYTISWDKRQPYVTLFITALLVQKKEIFDYTKGYYRHIMNNENNFPIFIFNE